MPDNQNNEEQIEEEGEEIEEKNKRGEDENKDYGEGSEEDNDEEESSGRGRFFQKIPNDVLLSPGGMVLLFFALIMEILDIVIPDGVGLTYILELIPEVIFMVLLKIIAGVSFLSMIIPLVIEKIPFVSDIVPSFFIKMLI